MVGYLVVLRGQILVRGLFPRVCLFVGFPLGERRSSLQHPTTPHSWDFSSAASPVLHTKCCEGRRGRAGLAVPHPHLSPAPSPRIRSPRGFCDPLSADCLQQTVVSWRESLSSSFSPSLQPHFGVSFSPLQFLFLFFARTLQ